jgi:hypothetical protein
MGMVVKICDRNDDRRVFSHQNAPELCGERISSVSAPSSYWSRFAEETGTKEVMDILFSDREEVKLDISHLKEFTDAWERKDEIPQEHHQVLLWFMFWMSHAIACFEDPIVVHY